jgi:hypothetical protein
VRERAGCVALLFACLGEVVEGIRVPGLKRDCALEAGGGIFVAAQPLPRVTEVVVGDGVIRRDRKGAFMAAGGVGVSAEVGKQVSVVAVGLGAARIDG